MREAGRYEDAELTLSAGSERFPDNEQIALAHAWVANERRDWLAALSRWEALRARFPNNPWCYVGNVHALRGLGRPDQVESLLAAAAAAFARRTPSALYSIPQNTPALRVFISRLIANIISPPAVCCGSSCPLVWTRPPPHSSLNTGHTASLRLPLALTLAPYFSIFRTLLVGPCLRSHGIARLASIWNQKFA